MRRIVIAAVAAALLVTALGAPAAADPADKQGVIPLDYWLMLENPCTGRPSPTHFTGELQVQALPSIDAFFTDEWTHLTLKWVGRFLGQDGYSSDWKHFATQVVNAGDEDAAHVVVTETDNNMHVGEDGGRFKVSYRFHVTVVDGEPTTFTDVFDVACIQSPEG